MKLPNSRYFRIGSEWLFDTEERVGYKVAEPQHNGKSRVVKDPSKDLQVSKAFTIKEGGGAMRYMPVPVGVIRKAEDILDRLQTRKDTFQ